MDSWPHHNSGRMKMRPPLSQICSWGPSVQVALRTRPWHRRVQRESAASHTTAQRRNTRSRYCRFTKCSAGSSPHTHPRTPQLSPSMYYLLFTRLSLQWPWIQEPGIGELVLWWVLGHSLTRDAPEERSQNQWFILLFLIINPEGKCSWVFLKEDQGFSAAQQLLG